MFTQKFEWTECLPGPAEARCLQQERLQVKQNKRSDGGNPWRSHITIGIGLLISGGPQPSILQLWVLFIRNRVEYLRSQMEICLHPFWYLVCLHVSTTGQVDHIMMIGSQTDLFLRNISVGWTIYHALEYLILGPTTDSLSSALLQQQILSIMAFLFIETFFYIIKFTETFCMPAQPFSSRLESLENLSRIQGCICIISQSFVKDKVLQRFSYLSRRLLP